VKNPKPMQTKPIMGAIHGIFLLEVQPKMKRPPEKKTEPIIIGGRRASGTALLLFCSNFMI